MKRLIYGLILSLTLLSAGASLTQTSRQVPAGSVVSLGSGGVAASAFAAGSVPDGAIPALGVRTDNRCTTTDATTCALIGLSKQNNYLLNLLATGTATSSVTDPCNGLAKTVVKFSIASGTTTELYDGSANNYVYVCAFNIVVGSADNVALVEDATDVCASPDAGMAGGVTAATGWNFAANGGLTLGNGNGTVMKSASTAVRVCLMTSTSAQASGAISFVPAP